MLQKSQKTDKKMWETHSEKVLKFSIFNTNILILVLNLLNFSIFLLKTSIHLCRRM